MDVNCLSQSGILLAKRDAKFIEESRDRVEFKRGYKFSYMLKEKKKNDFLAKL